MNCGKCKFFSRNITGNKKYGECGRIYSCDPEWDGCNEDTIDDLAYIETSEDGGMGSDGCLVVHESFWCALFRQAPNKIIFLDIDGVLNTREDLKNNVLINDKLVEKLKEAIKETEAKIVISSSWGEKVICELVSRGISPDDIIGVTPRNKRFRGEQIKDWLDEHDYKNYIVIDDEPFDICGEYCDAIPIHKVIKINPETGLTDEDVEMIRIKLL